MNATATSFGGFPEQQIHRYGRQIILPEIGGAGQRKLLDARVLLVGAGGLGSPNALYLGAATPTAWNSPTCTARWFTAPRTWAAARSSPPPKPSAT